MLYLMKGLLCFEEALCCILMKLCVVFGIVVYEDEHECSQRHYVMPCSGNAVQHWSVEVCPKNSVRHLRCDKVWIIWRVWGLSALCYEYVSSVNTVNGTC